MVNITQIHPARNHWRAIRWDGRHAANRKPVAFFRLGISDCLLHCVSLRRAADLPVEQPTKYVAATTRQFLDGLSAKALGLTVPPSLLAIAEEVIE
jgi:hypothetical protein